MAPVEPGDAASVSRRNGGAGRLTYVVEGSGPGEERFEKIKALMVNSDSVESVEWRDSYDGKGTALVAKISWGLPAKSPLRWKPEEIGFSAGFRGGKVLVIFKRDPTEVLEALKKK